MNVQVMVDFPLRIEYHLHRYARLKCLHSFKVRFSSEDSTLTAWRASHSFFASVFISFPLFLLSPSGFSVNPYIDLVMSFLTDEPE